ncbi:MAG: TonB-dependent receptor plug domain-containing protein [Gemmatimonadaceae bacterium]
MNRAYSGRERVYALACLLSAMPIAAAIAAPVAAASTTSPAVRGVVQDSVGTPLPNVTLTIAALRRVATTGPDGTFIFRGIPAGRHHIDAVLIGFARAEATADVPASGADLTLTIVMHPTPLRLSNVVVTATPEGGDALGITQSTVDLGGKELSRSLSSSLAQTLESEPGMGSRYNGPAANMPIIRGLTGERILVLQDGERSGDLSSAAPDHGTTIDPLAADRIEVVRGPASLLYGSSALGGVVNVISNEIPSSVPSHVAGFLARASHRPRAGAATGALTLPLGAAEAFTASEAFATRSPCAWAGRGPVQFGL